MEKQIFNDRNKNKQPEQSKIEKVDIAYSSEPWWYDIRGFLILTFSYRSTLPAQIHLFGTGIGPKHLEAAIGTGTLFDLILKWRKWKKLPTIDVLGFDYAERMLAGARKRFAKEKQIKLLRADAAHLDLTNNSFDTVNIANAIHCLPEVESSLSEMYRVLKPGGLLLGNCLLEPKANSFWDRLSRKINNWGMKKGILYRPYMEDEIIELLLKVGFEIKFRQVSGNCFNFIMQKPF